MVALKAAGGYLMVVLPKFTVGETATYYVESFFTGGFSVTGNLF
jgi:hypothetical protein